MVENALNAPFELMLGRLPARFTFGIICSVVLLLALQCVNVVNHNVVWIGIDLLCAAIVAVLDANLWASTQSWFAPFLAGLVVVPLIVLFRWAKPLEPSFITLDENAICLHWKIFLFQIRKRMDWRDVTHVSLIRPSAKTAPENWLVSFSSDKRFSSMKIRLTGLGDFGDRERILDALDRWAPQATRDPELLEAFTPAAAGSYTELWLQSLSAPPRRDRLKPLLAGASLQHNKYVVKEQLGAGGQGVAYLASVESGGADVVLKESILPIYLDIDVRKAALERFAKEAEMLRQLKHPQIVELIDFFLEDHRGYLVLEHIRGLSLRTLIDENGRISECRTVDLAKQMCSILTYLHSQAPPIVHRDFTPDNLILSSNNVLKLIDFTVADQSNKMKTATIVGKPSYMPPEQLRGKPCPQSDIYAMGACLFFLVTGENPEPISCSNPNDKSDTSSEEIAKLIVKATALKVEDRFQSISELALALEQMSLPEC